MGWFGNVFENAQREGERQFQRDMGRTGRQVGRDVSNGVGAALQDVIGGITGIDLSTGPNYRNYDNRGYGPQARERVVYDVRPRDGMDRPFGAYEERQNAGPKQSVDEIKVAQRAYEANLAATQAAYYAKLAELSGKDVTPAKVDPSSTTPVGFHTPEGDNPRGGVTSSPLPTERRVASPSVTAGAANLTVQQQQAYLNVLTSGQDLKLDGVKGAKTTAALNKFAKENGIDPSDTNAINIKLLEEIQKSPAAQALLDRAHNNPKSLGRDDRIEAQWVLKGLTGEEMHRSLKPNGRMDGEFGTETKTLLREQQIDKKKSVADVDVEQTAAYLTANAQLNPADFIGMRGSTVIVSNAPTEPASVPVFQPNKGGGVSFTS